MERFVYNPKYVKLLISMTGKTAQIDELAKQNDINAGHLRIVLDQWCKEGVIDKDRSGREYSISLTDKGEIISEKFAELMDLVRNYVPKVKEELKDETKKEAKGVTNDEPTTSKSSSIQE